MSQHQPSPVHDLRDRVSSAPDRPPPVRITDEDPFDRRTDDVWRRWLDGPRGRALRRRWAARHPELRQWRACELVAPVGGDRTDRMQAALVDLAQSGDSEAVFGLLIQLRPGLLGIVRTVAPLLGPDAAAEVRSAFLETLFRHRLDRRPRRIAANLVLDTRHRMTIDRARPLRPPDRPTVVPAPTPPPSGGPGRVELVDQLRRVIDRLPVTEPSKRLTAAVAYRAWFLGEPHDRIAEQVGIGANAVACRLHRLRGPLRAELLDHRCPGR